MVYNILSCSGFTNTATGWVASGGCLKGRIGLIILFFLIAVVRKWGGEEMGIDFSFWLSLLGGLGIYFVLITLTGNFKIALVVGIIASLIFGYGAGMIGLGSEGGYE